MYTKLQILIASLFFSCGMCHAQISDYFSDGNFSSSPDWSGNSSSYIVNTGQQLQLNAIGSGQSYLSISNTQPLDSCEWSFWIRLNFSPSSTNYARIYLASTQPDLTSALNGYYLQFGETLSNDQVELFRQSGNSSTSICRGTTVVANAFSIRVKITRDKAGLWKLFVDPSGGKNYAEEASGTDKTYTSSSYSGVLCKYTSSNATGFFFDDFYIYAPPDVIPASLDSVKVISENRLDVYFDEDVEASSAETFANYSVNNGIGFTAGAMQDTMDLSLVHLTFSATFENGKNYILTVTGVQDPAGNNTINGTMPFLFVRPSPNDIIINEVLFNPFDQGVEWVEIYNRSDKMIDLKQVFLSSRDNIGNLSEIKQIAPGGYMLMPQNYLVLSKNPDAIKAQYHTENPAGFLTMNSIPSLNNDSDRIVLSNVSQTILDEVHYNASWHVPMLNDTKGISLERINYKNPAQDKNNWHSAAESAGGATPAYKNSQYMDAESQTEITLSPEIFSPDNDGYNDILSISYAFDNPGMIGTIQIYDSRGRLEKNLVQSELLAGSGTFFWDGINDEYQKARVGIYVVYFEAFDTKGNVKKYKKICTLGGKL